MSGEKILVVDEEIVIRDFLTELLQRKQIDVTTAETGHQAINLLKHFTFDVVITAMKLPDLTGIDILNKIKELSPKTLVIVITAYASIENAVESMRHGAFDYLSKPFSLDSMEATLDKARDYLLLSENPHQHPHPHLSQQISPHSSSKQAKIIGKSSIMQQILSSAVQIAKSRASVFITGESGTGKEVIANVIHSNSPRVNSPFIKINCAAIPDALVESEFFGHEKGAFTGAALKRMGRFELADRGSLLLDEVTEIPLLLQPKLLRAIQEQEFERVGGSKPVKVDVRLISTSNRNIGEAITSRLFRKDLYYRLNVVPIHLPALRDRSEDVIPLAEYFLEKICQENNCDLKQLTSKAQKKLLAYPWPGNIRELMNVIERAVVLGDSLHIDGEHLLLDQLSSPSQEISLQELERRHIIETLQALQNDRAKTAEVLGISLRKLSTKIEAYHL